MLACESSANAETIVEEVSAIALEVRSVYKQSEEVLASQLNAIAETIVEEVSAIALDVTLNLAGRNDAG